MGDFHDLSKTLEQIEYEKGYRDGFLTPLMREDFLKRTTIADMQSRIWGWLTRKTYRNLFDEKL